MNMGIMQVFINAVPYTSIFLGSRFPFPVCMLRKHLMPISSTLWLHALLYIPAHTLLLHTFGTSLFPNIHNYRRTASVAVHQQEVGRHDWLRKKAQEQPGSRRALPDSMAEASRGR
jgi:hypothetical protein